MEGETSAAPAAPAGNGVAPPVGEPAPAGGTSAPKSNGTRAKDATTGRFVPGGGEAPKLNGNGETKPAPAAQAAAEEKRRLKLKVHGREDEYDEEQVREWAEIGAAGKHLFTEADRVRKETQDLLDRAGKDDQALHEFLKRSGRDPQKFARDLLISWHENESLTDAEKKERDLAAKEQAIAEREEALKRDAFEKQVATHTQAHDALLAQEIPAALAAVGIPHGPAAIEPMKEYLKRADRAGMALTPEVVKRAAEQTKLELAETWAASIRGKKGKELADLLGPEVVQELRQHDIQLWREKNAGTPAPAPAPATVPAKGAPHFVSMADLNKEFRKRGG